MNLHSFKAFLPELVILMGALGLFVVCLGEARNRLARQVAIATGVLTLIACLYSLGMNATLFSGAYRVELFSQILKVVFAVGFLGVLFVIGDLTDIRSDIKPEYYMFVTISVSGLIMLVSSIELITMVVALEVSSFPLYLMVPMRREREGQRFQMESAIKYIMFGVAANGIMFFGMGYLYGLTGTTHLPQMVLKLLPVIHTPLAIIGLAMTFCGLFYKLAVFPFHFWTPDVYQGASNETTTLIASLPKLGAVAVLVRLVSMVPGDSQILALLMTILAIGSMFYGNLIALVQKGFKRLLGFSGIAHAGYALMGFVALERAGHTAALFYITGYVLMVLGCFVVICNVSRDGVNVAIEDLAGLHKRSPVLAFTLLISVFALAGVPPFVGFIGKFALLKAAYSSGHVALVIIAVINSAIAIYYYLGVVREAYFREPTNTTPIVLSTPVRLLCLFLVIGICLLGIMPGPLFNVLETAVACIR
jgi:NADH-quinone oxidoreductase subunit N